MSTMGARLGLAAMAALRVSKADQFKVEGRFTAKNCALDGIQYTTGCTLGNGNLVFEDLGTPSFTLRMRDNSRSVTVSPTEGALIRFAGHKQKRTELLEEREISGLARAMEIDAEIARGFESLVLWVQSGDDGELVSVSAG